jgi:thiosulfate dehydrogenase (quinone) large subunit
MNKNYFTYLMVRLPIAVSMLCHGITRLARPKDFSEGMVNMFKNSKLPYTLVESFSYALPYVELVCGFLLLLGLATRVGIILGWLIMVVLVFGSSMIENWGAVFTQLFYALLFTILFYFIEYNGYSLDRIKSPGKYK